ncbi:842_t:CDS:1 [Entrophospora sp. SA101]|nr:15359_t:CDS:1 [Entrophospora sp. SA101]CAJ0829275.1 842_t:CDS:1 [Entrophospora sp. SA101]CAJ0906253.1 7817_t:CDS:1 [Entrophospora sp. SA101]CAJ0906280.1 7824_t:CDS:1 [Entrophospora sp. SA101]
MDEDNNNKENNIFNDQNTLPFFNGQTSSFHVPQTRGDNDFDYQNVQQNLFHDNSITQTFGDNNLLAYQNGGDNNHLNFNLVHDNFVNENSGDDNLINQNNFVDQNTLTSIDIASNSGFVKDNTFDGLTSIINNNNGLAGQNTAISTGINNNNNGFAEQNLFNANNNSAYQNQNNFVDQLNYIIFLLHQLLDNKNKQQ